MKESILHHIWKTNRYDLKGLETVNGIPVSIINNGIHNHDAGPDFLNAKVKIGTTIWAGHIEMHIKASDWERHKHQHDKAYGNVILHVVMEADKEALNPEGNPIPTMELKERVDKVYLDRYEQLMASLSWIPCEKLFHNFPEDKLPLFLESLLVKRLNRKYHDVKALLTTLSQDWEEVLYRQLMRYMGMKVNGEAFILLAERIPYRLLMKCESQFQKESLLFGQAGLLNGKDAYLSKMKKEYEHLSNKFGLSPMTGIEWKFARLRPANFPTIRIAQISALYQNVPQLFNFVLHSDDINSYREKINVPTSEYWDTHYLPDKESQMKKKKMGKAIQDTLLINVFIPLKYAYGEFTQNQKMIDIAIDMLGKIKAENNKIIRRWKEMQLKVGSAADSQALIELKSTMCDSHKCLDCSVGQQIVFENKSAI